MLIKIKALFWVFVFGALEEKVGSFWIAASIFFGLFLIQMALTPVTNTDTQEIEEKPTNPLSKEYLEKYMPH